MDLVMPGMDGIEATRRISEQRPAARILVLTSFAADDKVFPAIKAGALGYLLKDSSPEELVGAIRRVHQGEPSLEPSIARKVLQELSNPGRSKPTTDPLTERELEVLRLIAQGMSNKEIAEKICRGRVDRAHPRQQHPRQAPPRQPHPGGAVRAALRARLPRRRAAGARPLRAPRPPPRLAVPQ